MTWQKVRNSRTRTNSGRYNSQVSPKLLPWNPSQEPNTFDPRLCRPDKWEAGQRSQDIPFCELHAMRKKDAEIKTLKFLEHNKKLSNQLKHKISLVRVCTGKGKGILQNAIDTLLKQNSYNFKIHSDNEGVILVKLS